MAKQKQQSAKQEQAHILNELAEIAKKSISGPRPPGQPGVTWEGKSNDQDFSLLETEYRRFEQLAASLALSPRWRGRFSEEYFQTALYPVLRSIPVDGRENAGPLLDRLFEGLQDFDVKQTVFVPVSGIDMAIERLQIGEVAFFKATPTSLKKEAPELYLTGRPDKGEVAGEKPKLGNSLVFDDMNDKVVAMYRCVAEPTRAHELATIATRRALEALSFASCASLGSHPQAAAVFHIEGEEAQGLKQVFSFSNESAHSAHKSDPKSWSVQISGPYVDGLEQSGLFEISDILEQGSSDEESFDEDIMRALHWFSVAQVQAELETKMVYLITCIEALVGPPRDEPISNSVAEAVAIVIGRTVEARISIRKTIKEAYNVRSKISHGDRKESSESEVMEARAIVVELLKTLLQWRSGIAKRKDLIDWLLMARMSDKPVPPLGSPIIFPTLEERRTTRGWSVEELASESGLSIEQITTWERNGLPADGASLRKLSRAFGVALEAFFVPIQSSWLCVQNHKFLLTSRKKGPAEWESSVSSWDCEEAALWPVRPIDPKQGVDSPGVMLWWKDRDVTLARSLKSLAKRVDDALSRALLLERLPDEPEDWQPPEVPEHWRRHLAAKQEAEAMRAASEPIEAAPHEASDDAPALGLGTAPAH